MTVQAGTCSRCASGDHSSHMVSLGGICVGCACAVTPTTEPVVRRVDVLRRAAEQAHTLAEGAADSLHKSYDWHGIGTGYRVPIKEHIESWGPLQGIALADLFEEFARLDDQGIHPPTSVVTLARAYLGEA